MLCQKKGCVLRKLNFHGFWELLNLVCVTNCNIDAVCSENHCSYLVPS